MKGSVLTFDFGASTGRAIIYTLHDGRLHAEQISRFSTATVENGGALWWDYEYLFAQIDAAVKVAIDKGISCVGIDTWGCDFALVGEDGGILSPLHYRDKNVVGAADDAQKTLPFEKLYALTGIQRMDINTVYRFGVLDKVVPDWRGKRYRALMMADLFAWHLTGEMRCELTNASTTSMLNAKTHCFDESIFATLGLSKDLFAPIIMPGEIYGYVKGTSIPVVAVCTHDTASAVAAVPAEKEKFAYISSGTWSLMGTERKTPEIGERARQGNFTNEIGYGGSVRLLKNIMGLWILQQARQNLIEKGENVDFPDMAAAAASVNTSALIDPDCEIFMTHGNMLERVDEFLAKTHQCAVDSDAERLSIIYDSLALAYRRTMRLTESITGEEFDVLHVVGGGSQDKYLSQLTANAVQKPVITGPQEATAMGNAIVQFIALGKIRDLKEGRAIISASTEKCVYQPDKASDLIEKYKLFEQITEE